MSTRSEQLDTAPSNSVIVVGVDGSPSSAAALRWASHQARATGACLRVVTSWGYPRAYGYDVAYMDDWHPEQAARDAQGQALSAAAEDLDGVTVQTTVAEGEPARVLLDAAKEADLLVVGSRGHGELAGMLLGSVSEYCAAHAECPVVVVRPHHTSRR